MLNYSIKNYIKSIVTAIGIYEPLKYSYIFRIYTRLFKPELHEHHLKEVNFYRSFLQPSNLIFDIGAYDGHKTEAFLYLANKVVSCEPDKKNLQTLQTRFRRFKKRVFIEPVAIGSSATEQTIFIHKAGSAFNTLSEKFKNVLEEDSNKNWNEDIVFTKQEIVKVETLDNLIKKHGTPNFIKIDIEGYELEAIKGLHTKVPFISIECTFPQFESELQEIQQLLEKRFTNISYNIAIDEKLLLSSFVNKDTLNQIIYKYNIKLFETIIKTT